MPIGVRAAYNGSDCDDRRVLGEVDTSRRTHRSCSRPSYHRAHVQPDRPAGSAPRGTAGDPAGQARSREEPSWTSSSLPLRLSVGLRGKCSRRAARASSSGPKMPVSPRCPSSRPLIARPHPPRIFSGTRRPNPRRRPRMLFSRSRTPYCPYGFGIGGPDTEFEPQRAGLAGIFLQQQRLAACGVGRAQSLRQPSSAHYLFVSLFLKRHMRSWSLSGTDNL